MSTLFLTLVLLFPGAGEMVLGEDETIYEITEKGKEGTRYGAVIEKRDHIDIIWDTPWAPPQATYKRLKSKITYTEEPRVLRHERRIEQAAAAGYRFHEGDWITEDAWYAGRAREMARERENAPLPVPGAVLVEPAASPGFWSQWGLHLAVLAAGLGLTGFLLRGMRP